MDPMLYTSKGDSRLELTKRGIRQVDSLQTNGSARHQIFLETPGKRSGKAPEGARPQKREDYCLHLALREVGAPVPSVGSLVLGMLALFRRTTQTLLALYAGGFTQAVSIRDLQLTKTWVPSVLPGERGVRPRGPSDSGAGVRKLSGSGLDFQGWSRQPEMLPPSKRPFFFLCCQVRAEEQRVGRFYYRPCWGSTLF